MTLCAPRWRPFQPRLPAAADYDRAPCFEIAMAGIHITDIEAAINHWRARTPSPDGVVLSPELRALAEVYALMVYFHEDEADEFSLPEAAWQAWQAWYDTTPDTPCIAICSTSQGDSHCKGCGRTFDEVQHWPGMSATEKRHTWRRITQEGHAWRFNRYLERAAEGPAAAAQAMQTAAQEAHRQRRRQTAA